MATLRIRDEERVIRQPDAIRDFLARHGLWYRRLGELPELPDDDAAILRAFEAPLRELRTSGGYAEADVVRIRPETPDVDAMLRRFEREHTHDDDEVRIIVDGRGLFHVHPEGGPVFSIEVEAGDCINVPEGTRHWFHVCEARRCTAVRLFRDASGWTPHYTGSGIDGRYAPIFSAR